MPILVDFVFQFLRLCTYKSSITLLISLMSWKWQYMPSPLTKLVKVIDNQARTYLFQRKIYVKRRTYYLNISCFLIQYLTILSIHVVMLPTNSKGKSSVSPKHRIQFRIILLGIFVLNDKLIEYTIEPVTSHNTLLV